MSSSRVSHGDGQPKNYCKYKAQFRGTLSTGGAYSSTSTATSGCTPIPFYVDRTIGRDFRSGTLFYGQAYHDGAWAPGSPALEIRR